MIGNKRFRKIACRTMVFPNRLWPLRHGMLAGILAQICAWFGRERSRASVCG